MTTPVSTSNSEAASGLPKRGGSVFGVNEVRLNARQWGIAAILVVTFALAAPRIWKKVEPLQAGADYRVPYALSKDYWLWQRRLEQAPAASIPILGDSVVWGEYVRPDGTLSHFLNAQEEAPQFVNCGVNGLFPLALVGLVSGYGGELKNRKVIVQCNLLWLTSPQVDLSAPTEQRFNHSRLVPQFDENLRCYRADASERFSACLDRRVSFYSWVQHLQIAYFDQRSLPQWTLEDDGNIPPKYVNAWRNPWTAVAAGIPGEPANDPQRGPTSRRHKAWNTDGAEPTHFEWVGLWQSKQWGAFEQLVHELHEQGNDVLVILGPFNTHMVAPEQRETYEVLRAGVTNGLARDATVVQPEVLPSELYADASHPLTEGYEMLARRLWGDEGFRKWVGEGRVLSGRAGGK